MTVAEDDFGDFIPDAEIKAEFNSLYRGRDLQIGDLERFISSLYSHGYGFEDWDGGTYGDKSTHRVVPVTWYDRGNGGHYDQVMGIYRYESMDFSIELNGAGFYLQIYLLDPGGEFDEKLEKVKNAFRRATNSFDFLIPRDDKHDLPDFYNFLETTRDIDDEIIAESIKAMGYDDFLRTDYWRMIAAQIRRMQQGLCALCPNECVDVHHPDYSVHGYEHSEGMRRLVALCKRCHENCWYKGRQGKTEGVE